MCLKDDPWKSADREITANDFMAINEILDICASLDNKTGMWGH